ncbi:MAG: hypothetical protein IJB70_09590 [Clostridia bacterium]|nr:hypothetical protein [Clostridia bacterium]
MKVQKIKITSSPQCWEIIQHQNGFADFDVSGIFEENTDDDTWQEIPFSTEMLYVRIMSECDGSLVIPLVRLTVEDMSWHVRVNNVPCGGPYTMDIVLYNPDLCVEQPLRGNNIRHFCVGDVFLIAGQSNAAGMGRGTVCDEPEPGVHVLRNLDFWDIATAPFNEYDYSKNNMFLSFAKKIKKTTGIPVGLIPAAMGGSPLSRWLVAENGDLYLKMKNALKSKNIGFKAVLWYQGCTDAGDGVSCKEYLMRFEKLTKQFRSDFSMHDLPFFTFQLNRQIRTAPNERLSRSYDEIREAQRLAAHKITNTYILPAIDAVHMSDFIHISKLSAIMLGERLASQVLNVLYSKGMPVNAPDISSATVKDSKKLIIEFSNVTEFLYDYNASLDEYPIEIEDANGKQNIEKVLIRSNTLEIQTQNELKAPIYISGQTGTDPKRILIDFGTQMPMLCFWRYVAETSKADD